MMVILALSNRAAHVESFGHSVQGHQNRTNSHKRTQGSQKKDKRLLLIFVFSAFFCGKCPSLAGFNGMREFRASISRSADFYFLEV
jgi:hypothetical protein